MDGQRIAKYLASAGVASRREAEKLIADGRVAVDGRTLTTPAFKVDGTETILVDGRPVARPDVTRLWRYHKRSGLVTTNKDPEGRPTIFGALPPNLPRVVTVGRLDLNTEGLLLLTNDGELARALELPATGLRRTYRARAYGRVAQHELDRLRDGLVHDGQEYRAITATLDRVTGANCWIDVSLSEGKKREVRRALESLGLKVNRLIRTSYGPFQLLDLPLGAIEEVDPADLLAEVGQFISPERLPAPFADRRIIVSRPSQSSNRKKPAPAGLSKRAGTMPTKPSMDSNRGVKPKPGSRPRARRKVRQTAR